MKKKVLFIYPAFSTFVKTDYEILSEEFEVVKFHARPPKGFAGVFEMIWQFIYIFFNGWKYDVFFIWFADYHSFIPVLFAKVTGKKSFVVIGGYDVARIRKLKYGAFYSRFRGWIAKISMKNCTLNLPVSNFVARKVRAITRQSNFFMIYNCVNLKLEDVTKPVSREIVVTVVNVVNERTYLLKGLDTYVEVAKKLPDIQFYIIGLDKNKFAEIIKSYPANLHVSGFVEHSKLADYYRRTKVYCQFSRIESFGVALAEAMYYGCIPMITNEGAMPEIIDDSQFIFQRDEKKIASKIKEIFFSEIKMRTDEFQKNIANRFSVNQRKDMLFEMLNHHL